MPDEPLHTFTTKDGLVLNAMYEQLALLVAAYSPDRALLDKMLQLCSPAVDVIRWDPKDSRPTAEEKLLPSFVVLKQGDNIFFIMAGTMDWSQTGSDFSGFVMRTGFNSDDDVWCHGFFKWCADKTEERLAAELDLVEARHKLFFAGHSLGGATAFLLACRAATEFPESRVELLTAGEPRSLSAGYDRPQPDKHVRLVNFSFDHLIDPVTELPASSWLGGGDGIAVLPFSWITNWTSYRHYGDAVWIQSTGEVNGGFQSAGKDYEPPQILSPRYLFPHLMGAYIRSAAGAYARYGGRATSAAMMSLGVDAIEGVEGTYIYMNLPDPRQWLDLPSVNKAAGNPAPPITNQNVERIDIVTNQSGPAARLTNTVSGGAAAMSSIHRITLKYNQRNQGWAETHYVKINGDFLQMSAKGVWIREYLKRRAPMLGNDTKLVQVSTVNVENPFYGDDAKGESFPDDVFTDNLAPLPGGNSWDALDVQIYSAHITRRVQMRGWPDEYIKIRLVGKPLGAANLGEDQFSAYANWLKEGLAGYTYQLRSIRAAATGVTYYPIQDVSSDPTTRRWVITLGTANVFTKNQEIVVEKVRGTGTEGINGKTRVRSIATGGLEYTLTKRKCSRCDVDVDNWGRVRALAYLWEDIVNVGDSLRVTVKKPGAPFAVQPGRHNKQCCG